MNTVIYGRYDDLRAYHFMKYLYGVVCSLNSG